MVNRQLIKAEIKVSFFKKDKEAETLLGVSKRRKVSLFKPWFGDPEVHNLTNHVAAKLPCIQVVINLSQEIP